MCLQGDGPVIDPFVPHEQLSVLSLLFIVCHLTSKSLSGRMPSGQSFPTHRSALQLKAIYDRAVPE